MNAIDVLRRVSDATASPEGHEALDRLARLVEADKEFDAARAAIIYAGLNLDEEMYRVGSRLQMASMVRSIDLAAVLGEESGNG